MWWLYSQTASTTISGAPGGMWPEHLHAVLLAVDESVARGFVIGVAALSMVWPKARTACITFSSTVALGRPTGHVGRQAQVSVSD